MVGAEYLALADRSPQRAYSLLEAVKIRRGHGRPGRTISLH
jgi:hypothetical protein